ncbi:MAG: hypothetical protein M3T56_04865 [Chloroflexota bacterium]|nr:hypothetical protein [Chloroflexota bacterium]
MNDQNPVERERLGEPVATVEVNDCRLTFRRRIGTNDVWSVAIGPLGTFAVPVIEEKILRRVQAGRPGRDATRDESSRRRTMGWQHVRIEDDFVVAVRARGNRLSFAYLFGDGASFGGGESGLPTLHPANLLERARSWLSGQRGEAVHRFRRQG